jgi:hypothetical protein
MSNFRLLPLAFCIAGAPAFALDQGEYSLNGFGTAAITRLGGASDAKGYGIHGQTTDSWRGDQLSKLGGQFRYGLTDELSATVQAVAKAQEDTWKVDVTWAYLAYEINDQLTVRAGRMRPNSFMYSETLDIGYSYPWLRLPDVVYSQMPIVNYDGIDALYSLPLSFGSLDFQGSYGQTNDEKVYIGALDDNVDLDAKEELIGSVTLTTGEYGNLRYSYMQTNARVDDGPESTSRFKSLGYQYDNGTWLTNAEATNRRATDSTDDAFYIMAGRRFGDFLPHVTYAQWDQRDAGRESSWSYGLNYRLAPNITLKGEYKRVETTKGFLSTFAPDFTSATRTLDGDIISIGADFVF